MTKCLAGTETVAPAKASTYTTEFPFPAVTLPVRAPPIATLQTVRAATKILLCIFTRFSSLSKNKFRSEHDCVHTERIGGALQAGDRIGDRGQGLLRPDLIFHGRLQIGADQKLYSRRKPVARRRVRREVGRAVCQRERVDPV